VRADEPDLGDGDAVLAAEPVEAAVAADDPEPGEHADPDDVHLPQRNEIAAEQQRNVLRQRQPQPAGKQQPEEDEIAPPFEPPFDLVEAEYGDKVHKCTARGDHS
jgi:hypothetical protein